MKLISLLLLSALVSTPALAVNFNFEKESCTVVIDNDVLFEINKQSFKSQVKTELVFSGAVPLPKIRLTFLQHEPTNATIQWQSILVERKNQKFFRPEIIDRLRQEENQVFPMKRLSPVGQIAVYETEALDLGRSQDLVALFLSQNEFIIGATTEGGDVWQAKQSLNASDSSYRQMAASCYPQLTATYLKPSGERIAPTTEVKGLSPYAIAVSEGYGLTGFTWMEELLPTALRGTNALALGAGTDEKKITDLVALLRQKRDAQEIFNRETTNPDYIQLNEQLAGYYDQLTQIYSRFVILTGNSPEATESLIAQKVKEEETLRLQLAAITTQIEQSVAAQTLSEQEYATAEQALAPHMQQLVSFDQSMADIAQKMKDMDLLRLHLVSLLEEQQKILGDQAATLGGEITAPWSAEEIEAKAKENADRQNQIQLVTAMKAQVEVIAADAKILLEKSTAQQNAAGAYLAAVNDQRVRKGQLSTEEAWLRQSLEVPNFTIANEEFFLHLNQTVEQQIIDSKAVRDYNGEFDTHAALYDNAQAAFVELVEKSRQGGASLFASVLCNPNVLMDEKNRTHACLTIDEVLNENISDSFFNSLPPKDLDALLTSVQKPWAQEVSKSQILIDRLKKEINQPTQNLQIMVDAWGSLRHIIWRWVTMQKEAAAFDACAEPKPIDLYKDKVFTAAFYETVFRCEKAQVSAHQQARDQALSALNETPAVIAQANAVYDQADAEFTSYSDLFMTNAVNKIKEVSRQANFSQLFVSCILPMERAEECSASLDTSVADAATKLTEEQASYLEMAKALFMNINARMTAISNETSSMVAQTQQIQQGKADYMAQNNIEALINNKQTIRTRLDSAVIQIAELLKTETQQRTALNSASQQEGTFRTEAKTLVGQIQSVSTQIAQLLPAYQPFCAAILPSSEKMLAIDGQIYELFGKTGDTVVSKPYSSCQMPSLDHFVPNNDFITPTLLPQR